MEDGAVAPAGRAEALAAGDGAGAGGEGDQGGRAEDPPAVGLSSFSLISLPHSLVLLPFWSTGEQLSR